MRILPDVNPAEFEIPQANSFTLPQGLIGFQAYTGAELLYQPGQLPFLWLKLRGPFDNIYFIVVEPAGVIPGYDPELFDQDAAGLDLAGSAEALVLNIVSLKNMNPMEATVNLVGPIIVNRRTKIARQLVVANYSRYSAQYQLVDSRVTAAACA
jgi:flagellar assembly factor FliW